MMRAAQVRRAAILLLLLAPGGPATAAAGSGAAAATVADSAAAPVLTIVGLSGATLDVTADMLAELPRATVIQPVEDGTATAYEGPLLWAVLDRAGALSPSSPEQAGQAVLVSGEEGTTTLLALAEIAPNFEGKQVILADRQDGRALPDGAVALIVPGDRHPGRSLSDVTRIGIVSP